jgi:hypothetical protein
VVNGSITAAHTYSQLYRNKPALAQQGLILLEAPSGKTWSQVPI